MPVDNQRNFVAPINAWVQATKERREAVYKGSIQEFARLMTLSLGAGGNMPVRDGFLRASIRATTGAYPPLIDRAKNAVGAIPFDLGDVNLVIAGAKMTDKISLVFTAKYARRVNYGFHGADSLGRVYNQQGRQFVGLTAQQWPQIVARQANSAQNAVANRNARVGMTTLAGVERNIS